MGYGDILRRLLRPMDVYDLRPESLSGSELDALGTALDGAEAAVDYSQREGCIASAEGEGLERWEALFAHTPVRRSPQLRRQALAALLRVGPGAFTLAAVNDTLSGCGISATVEEKDQFGYVRVLFPEVVGVPEDFEQIQAIILDIIPCHLDVEFYFRYLTWAECHGHQYTWALVHEKGWSWHDFMLAV